MIKLKACPLVSERCEENARQILVSEMVLVQGKGRSGESLLEDMFD